MTPVDNYIPPPNDNYIPPPVNSYIPPPVNSYIPQLPLYAKKEGERSSGSQEKRRTPDHNFECMLPALPPSFATLLMDCSENNHGL